MTITTKKEEQKEDKKPETLQDYKDQGWEVGPSVGMSFPPTYTLTKDGKTIKFRPKMKKESDKFIPKKDGKGIQLLNKGGIVKRYKGGLMVKPKAAKRGY